MDAQFASRPDSHFAVALSADDVASFRANGHLSIERITTDEEIDWLREVYDALFRERRGGVRGGYFDLSRPYESDGADLLPQIILPERRVPALLETAYFLNVRKLGAALLGAEEDAVGTWGHMIMKPPHVGDALAWHQDEAYWDPQFSYEALAVWMPLDPATLESGCMHFIPRSHHTEVRDHRHRNDDPNVHGLYTNDVDPSLAVAVPVPTGGATFHHCRTLHYSGPNTSDRVRRAWSIEVQLPPVARAVPAVRPWFTETTAAWSKRTL